MICSLERECYHLIAARLTMSVHINLVVRILAERSVSLADGALFFVKSNVYLSSVPGGSFSYTSWLGQVSGRQGAPILKKGYDTMN